MCLGELVPLDSGCAGWGRAPTLGKPEGAGTFPEEPLGDLGGSWKQPRAAKGKEVGSQVKT